MNLWNNFYGNRGRYTLEPNDCYCIAGRRIGKEKVNANDRFEIHIFLTNIDSLWNIPGELGW